jgi:hypothetical protein
MRMSAAILFICLYKKKGEKVNSGALAVIMVFVSGTNFTVNASSAVLHLDAVGTQLPVECTVKLCVIVSPYST